MKAKTHGSSLEERDVPRMVAGILRDVFNLPADIQRLAPLRIWAIDNWLFLQHEPLAATDNWIVWTDVPDGHLAGGFPCIMNANRRRVYHKTFWAAALTLVQTVGHLRGHTALEDAARDCGHTPGRYLVTHVANKN